MDICKGCRLYSTNGVGCVSGGSACCNNTLFEEVGDKLIQGCGCNLTIKGRSLSSSCPLGKWKAVLSMKEEEILNKQLDENKGQG